MLLPAHRMDTPVRCAGSIAPPKIAHSSKKEIRNMVIRLKSDRSATGSRCLLPGNCYRVIGLYPSHYRIMSDSGEPLLFESHLFRVVSWSIPNDWVFSIYINGNSLDVYATPESLSRSGFFEDYFEDKPEAVQALRSRLVRWNEGEDYVFADG